MAISVGRCELASGNPKTGEFGRIRVTIRLGWDGFALFHCFHRELVNDKLNCWVLCSHLWVFTWIHLRFASISTETLSHVAEHLHPPSERIQRSPSNWKLNRERDSQSKVFNYVAEAKKNRLRWGVGRTPEDGGGSDHAEERQEGWLEQQLQVRREQIFFCFLFYRRWWATFLLSICDTICISTDSITIYFAAMCTRFAWLIRILWLIASTRRQKCSSKIT